MKNQTRKNRGTRKAKSLPLKPVVKQAMTNIAKRVFAHNTENKMIGWEVEKDVQHNSAISGADCEPLVQQIVQIDSATGNTAQQRMGDRVKPKSLTVKGVLSLQPTTSTTCQPVYVRVVIAAQKSIKVGSAVLAGNVDTNRLLKPGFAGVGTDQVPFAGNTAELNYPINKDLFRVYMDRVFQIGSGIPGSGGYPESPYPDYCKRWSYTFKQMPTALTWDEGNGDWPNNFAPFVAIGYAYSDGTSPDVITTRIISNTTSFFTYEDA